MVRTWCFHCCGLGSIPGRGTKILQAVQCSQKKKKEKSGGIIGNLYFPFHSTMNFLKFCDGYCKQESYKRKKTFSHV